MRRFAPHFLDAGMGQLKLISKGSSFISRANSSISLISHRADSKLHRPPRQSRPAANCVLHGPMRANRPNTMSIKWAHAWISAPFLRGLSGPTRAHQQNQFIYIMGQCEHFAHQPFWGLKATWAHAAVSSGSQLRSPWANVS